MRDPELLTIKEFAARTMLGYTKARQLMRSEAFVKNGLVVNADPENPDTTKRLDWAKYREYIAKNSPVLEMEWVRPKLKAYK